MSTPNQAELAKLAQTELVERELSRSSLIAFTERFTPEYHASWAHRLVAANLEKFYEDVRAGRDPRLMLFLSPRFGKEVAHSTEVWSNRGLIQHGDLKVGDKVYTEHGTPTEVQALSEEHKDNWVVTISDGTEVRCHGNHEWTVRDRTNKKKGWFTVETRWLNAKTKFGKQRSLYHGTPGKRGCSYVFALPNNSKPIELPENSHEPIPPYLLGIWLGDGSKAAPQICYDPRKKQHIDRITSMGYKPTRQWPHPNKKEYENVHYAYYGGGLLRPKLKDLGVWDNKHIPEEYITASVEQRLELLAGLIDSDGTVDKTGRVTFTNTNKQLVDSVYALAQSLALRPYRTRPEKPALSSSGIQGTKPIYIMGFQPHIPIPTVVKPVTRLIKQRYLSITSVRREPNGEKGRCIQVANPSGLYRITRNQVPTHNSRLASQMFPAWALGHWPEAEFMIASYSAALTLDFSRVVKSTIDDPAYTVLFPGTCLDQNSKAVDNWYTTRSGRYYPTSCGGSLTGKGCNFLICDDLVKDSEVADSESQLDKIYEWYTSTAMTRLAPKSGIIQIMTRWADADPAGRLLAHQQEQEKNLLEEMAVARNPEFKAHLRRELDALEKWNVISFPALATHDEYITPELTLSHERKPGYIHVRSKDQAIHPERFDEGALNRIRKALPRRHWNSLYQQNPVPEEGSFFQKSYFQYHPVIKYPEFPVLQAWDFAIGTKQQNDWTVGVTGYLDYTGILHIIEVVRIKEGTFGIVTAIADQAQKHSPSLVGMEHGHITMSILPVLEEELKSRRVFPAIDAELVAVHDKIVRARPLQGMLQRGMISIDSRKPWYEDFVREALRFPHGVFDDQVDALAHLARMALEHPLPQKSQKQVRKSWKDKLKTLTHVKTGTTHLGA